MHTTRNTFKRENFNTKNTEIAFYSFKQYLSMDFHIDTYRCTTKEMEIYLKHFIFFHVPEQKSFQRSSKTKAFLVFQVMFHMLDTYAMYLDIGRDDDDDYDDA